MHLTSRPLLLTCLMFTLLTGCADEAQPTHDAGLPDGEAPGFVPADPDPFAGTSGPIEIRVDHLGIPHIYGSSDADAYYGAGYMSARHRLFQMELLRLRAHGEWSSVAGPDHAEDDRLSRLLGFRNHGQRDARVVRDSGGEAWELLVAWAAGINRFVEEVRDGAQPTPYGSKTQ